VMYPSTAPLPSSTLILAGDPMDQQITVVAQGLQQGGWNPIITPTPLDYAGKAPTCLVVLAPDNLDSQTVRDALQAGYPCLIPLMKQPTSLPFGRWTEAAIVIGADAGLAMYTISQVAARFLSTAPPSAAIPSGALGAPPSTPMLPSGSVPVPAYPPGVAGPASPYPPSTPGPAWPIGPSQPYPPTPMPPTGVPPQWGPSSPYMPSTPYQPHPTGVAVATNVAAKGLAGLSSGMRTLLIVGTLITITVVGIVVVRNNGNPFGPSSVAGTWTEIPDVNGQTTRDTLDLQQNGSTVTGSLSGPTGQGLALSGTLSGQQLVLHGDTTQNTSGITETATYQQTGTVSSDFQNMSGDLTVTVTTSVQLDPSQPPTTSTQTYNGTWTASRGSSTNTGTNST
jgi:hypothetical protein